MADRSAIEWTDSAQARDERIDVVVQVMARLAQRHPVRQHETKVRVRRPRLSVMRVQVAAAVVAAVDAHEAVARHHVVAPLLRALAESFPAALHATTDDATVRKWLGFVDRWNGWRFIVGNAFAYRATDVRELQRAADPVGPDADFHLQRIAREADVLVPCWGDTQKVPPALRPRFAQVLQLLRASGKPVMCFGLTAGGDPKHPLMLPYSTPLVPYGATT